MFCSHMSTKKATWIEKYENKCTPVIKPTELKAHKSDI